jgi:hypothetical protein
MENVTAVQWFLKELIRMDYFIGNDMLQAFEQANAMFNKQIKDAHCDGQYPFENIHNAEKYYNQTFKKD